jgi:hypothetical protein
MKVTAKSSADERQRLLAAYLKAHNGRPPGDTEELMEWADSAEGQAAIAESKAEGKRH